MESDDGDDTHRPFTTLSWQALLIVRRLKIQAPERRAEAEAAARKFREERAKQAQVERPPKDAPAHAEDGREAVKFK